MVSLFKTYVSSFLKIISNRIYYLGNKNSIHSFLKENGFRKIKPFNLNKWHHDLSLFTAKDDNGNNVFIKFTELERILENENSAYKKLQKNDYLKNHLIDHKGYIQKDVYKALILRRVNGKVLNENWASKNITKLEILIKIVNEFTSLSLVHRDIKLDNFIYEEGRIKIFDFSFMIDKSNKGKMKEINLSSRKNMFKLMDLGIHYKPEPLKWDDYYSLYVIFNKLLKNKSLKISLKKRNMLSKYVEECKGKIDTNSYTILK